MSASFDTLVEDIYGLFDKNEHIDIPKEVLEDFAKNVAGACERAVSEGRGARKPRTLYASEVGEPCVRKLWYKQREADYSPDPILPHARIKFLYGDLLEELLILLARSAGHTVTHQQEPVVIELANGWRISGRIDGVVDGRLVDFKSASSYGMKKFQGGLEEDPFGYRGQLAAYESLGEDDEASIVAIDKTLGHVATVTFSKGDLVEDYPLSYILDVTSQLESDELPPRAFGDVPAGKSGNKKLPMSCSYCSFNKHCWPSLRTFIYSYGPEYLTEVVREPKVPEVK